MKPTVFRAVAGATAIGALVVGALTSQVVFFVLASVAGLLLATSFRHARSLTGPLLALRGQPVDVQVWGTTLPIPSGSTVRITSVAMIGAGLHIYFQVGGAGSASHLKVAQPRSVLVRPRSVVIEAAAYVQWSSQRLPRVTGAPALAITVSPAFITAQHEAGA